jgi:hypothetical protein
MFIILLIFLFSCSTYTLKDPTTILNTFNLEGEGRGRFINNGRKASFSFESKYAGDNLIIALNFPFHGEELITIKPNDLVLPKGQKVISNQKRLLLTFLEILRTKDYTCQNTLCTFKKFKFIMRTEKDKLIIKTKDIYASILGNDLEIKVGQNLQINLSFTR